MRYDCQYKKHSFKYDAIFLYNIFSTNQRTVKYSFQRIKACQNVSILYDFKPIRDSQVDLLVALLQHAQLLEQTQKREHGRDACQD